MDTDWLKVLQPDECGRLGHVRHVLFDFDGTLSVLREGWEEVMIPLMIEMICDEAQPSPAIDYEVRDYVDRSTGIVTIEQMQWLAEAVRRHGLASAPRSAADYKRVYVRRLLVRVEERLRRLNAGELAPDEMMIAGGRAFLEGLCRADLRLYLASGTDHEFVLNEAQALQVAGYFQGGIYGALDNDDAHRKERIIARILDENDLYGNELLVVGDGPVELRLAAERGALALGVASDEITRHGWNPAKVARLTRANAHFLVPDFSHHESLLSFLAVC